MFDKFTDSMVDFPYIRVAIFSVLCGIACIIFKFYDISWIFFGISGLAIIDRFFSSVIFQNIEHILMKISMVSCWLGIKFAIISALVSIFLPKNENVASWYLLTDLPKFVSLFVDQGFANESVIGIIVLILTIASSASLVLFVIILLLRIFVAMFDS